MKSINFFSNNNLKADLFNEKKLSLLSKKFEKEYSKLKKDIFDKTKTLNVLSDRFQYNFKIKDLKKFDKFKNIAIIGMGGSILGTEAIYGFLKNKIKKKLYFFNNLEEQEINNFKKKKINLNTLFIIVSKSGNTIETIYNIFSLGILKKDKKNIIIITEKKNNVLFFLSKKFNLFYVEHKSHIGGRYSVLSEVGLVPAFLMGIDITKLRSKIFNYLNLRNKKILKHNAIKLAYYLSSKKYSNLIFLNYEAKFEKFLYWCQQLIAESLGKQNKGFLPIVSNAPKDHHSLLQLYLDGPKNKLFSIFSLNKKSNLKISIKEKKLDAINILNKKDLRKVKNSQKNALIKSFLRKKIPFREFTIKENNETTLGQLFSYFILETIIVGKMLNINPFDQPAVEQVKIDTKKILKKTYQK